MSNVGRMSKSVLCTLAPPRWAGKGPNARRVGRGVSARRYIEVRSTKQAGLFRPTLWAAWNWLLCFVAIARWVYGPGSHNRSSQPSQFRAVAGVLKCITRSRNRGFHRWARTSDSPVAHAHSRVAAELVRGFSNRSQRGEQALRLKTATLVPLGPLSSSSALARRTIGRKKAQKRKRFNRGFHRWPQIIHPRIRAHRPPMAFPASCP